MVVGWRGTLYAWVEKVLPCDEHHRLLSKIEIERGKSFKRERSCITGKVQKERGGYRIGDMINVGHGHVVCRQCDESKGAIPRWVEVPC